jgi:diguanylate cyclase (GGDEF)-like protein
MAGKNKGKERDLITNLPSRRSLEQDIKLVFNEGIVKVSEGADVTHSIIMFDIDFFKSINDLYSHKQGDDVLATVGYILNKYKRETDLICLIGRWGEEEFLMVVPYDTRRIARYVADEIREQVASSEFEDTSRGGTLKEKITISLGVNYVDLSKLCEEQKTQNKDLKTSIDEELQNANVALDYAKFMGKNRVEVFIEKLAGEMKNLEQLRRFYFENAHKKARQLRNLFDNDYFLRNPNILKKIKRHFEVIREEINERDTRTQAVFADKLYREEILGAGEECRKQFIDFMDTYQNIS